MPPAARSAAAAAARPSAQLAQQGFTQKLSAETDTRGCSAGLRLHWPAARNRRSPDDKFSRNDISRGVAHRGGNKGTFSPLLQPRSRQHPPRSTCHPPLTATYSTAAHSACAAAPPHAPRAAASHRSDRCCARAAAAARSAEAAEPPEQLGVVLMGGSISEGLGDGPSEAPCSQAAQAKSL